MRRGLSVLLVLGVAAAPLAWVPSASAAATWLPEVTASGDVVDVSQVEVAADPAGNVTAVWSAQVDDVPGVLQTATRPVGAADFGPVQTPMDESLDLVDLVGHPDGAATIVAITQEGLVDEIVAATRAGGTGDFPELATIPGSGGAGDTVVAVDGKGAVTVVWEVDTPDGTVMNASTRDAATGTWSPPEPVAPEDPDILRIVVDSRGTVTVVWTQLNSEGDGEAVVAASRAPGASFSVAVVDDGEGYIDDLELAGNANGVAALAWRKTPLLDDQVRVAVRPVGATGFATAVPVPGSSGYDSDLALEVDSAGQAITAWVDVASQGIVVVTRSAGGSFRPPVSAGGIDAGSVASGLVSELDGHGALTLAWLTNRAFTEGSVVASRRGIDGTFVAVDIAESGGYLTHFVDVATDARGDVAVVHEIDTGSSEYVAARVLDASGPSLSVTGSARGATASLTAQASDAWSSPTSVTWDFGDGASGTGTATSHTYAASGRYTVRATASDAVGNTTTATTMVSVTVPIATAVDRKAPTLSGAQVKPKVLPVKRIAKLLVTSSEKAGLKAVVERRRTNGKWRQVGKKSWSVEAGPNKERLYGKRAQKKLASGRFRLHLTATDIAGNVSGVTTVRFRVDA